MDLDRPSASDAANAIASGRITAEELVRACLKQIEAREPTVGAWTHLDTDHAITQAKAADSSRKQGRPLGPLHGIPVGVKDIFDTADLPTENGTVLHSGRRPTSDSTVVSLLREAGAIILGKTVTTEFAVYSPGKTTNPHDPRRTPGGSSSGSAAAVAAGMVPLAVGSQTNGSVIRPAAYCGVYGFKPTSGLISRHGVLRLSRQLDQIGVFARTVEDVALIAEALMRFDARDGDMRPQAPPALRAVAATEPPVQPRLAFIRTPVWDEATTTTKDAFDELVTELGGNVEEMNLPPAFDEAIATHRAIFEADIARNLATEFERGAHQLSPVLREIVERGQRVPAVDYIRAVERIETLNRLLQPVFEWSDAIVTPAVAGEAPVGLDSTGSPIFCTLWTLCGVPAVTVPILQGESGMPIGVQLIGPRGDDARLLRTARWLVNLLG